MMEILVVYETMYGNTRRVAEAIASGFDGEPGARAVPVAEVVADDLDNCALLIVGGPTQQALGATGLQACCSLLTWNA